MLKVGDAAPDFTLKDQDGKEVSLQALRGQKVVLVFYPLAFTSICTGELKEISAHQQKYDAAGARVFGISVDSSYSLAEFKKKEGITSSLLADFHPKGAVAQKYGVYMEQAGISKRGTFIIDGQGTIRFMTVNDPGKARNEAEYFEGLAACPV
jgi:peroxiredoxin